MLDWIPLGENVGTLPALECIIKFRLQERTRYAVNLLSRLDIDDGDLVWSQSDNGSVFFVQGVNPMWTSAA